MHLRAQTSRKIRALIVESSKADSAGKTVDANATWNAICLANREDRGVVFAPAEAIIEWSAAQILAGTDPQAYIGAVSARYGEVQQAVSVSATSSPHRRGKTGS